MRVISDGVWPAQIWRSSVPTWVSPVNAKLSYTISILIVIGHVAVPHLDFTPATLSVQNVRDLGAEPTLGQVHATHPGKISGQLNQVVLLIRWIAELTLLILTQKEEETSPTF